MKGVVFTGNSTVTLMDFPDPAPGPRDVVIRIGASGVCGSDLHMFTKAPNAAGLAAFDPNQSEPVIAGHEPTGTIVEVGADVARGEAHVGQRVICFHYSGCGTCRFCLMNRPQLCASTVGYGGTGHGGHAEFLTVPVSTVVALPDELGFDVGACLACGTGTAYGALKRLPQVAGDTVVVVGTGPVGASAVMLANAMGARVVAVDVDASRRADAIEFGAEVVIDPLVEDAAARVRDLTDGYGADAAIETSGATEGRLTAIESTRLEGAAVFLGLGGGELSLAFDRDVVMAPRALLGSRTFSKDELAACTRFVAEHNVPVGQLVSGRFALDQAQKAYELFAGGGTRKHILVP